MAGTWLDHVKQTMKVNPGVAFKDVLKIAKKTWSKAGTEVKKTKSKGARKLSRRIRQIKKTKQLRRKGKAVRKTRRRRR